MITSSTDITAEELKERLNKGETPIIIDVREDWEYQEANIAGAKNIPLGTLPQRLDDIEDLKNQEVIVQCRSGARSANAKAFLQQQGFSNVRNLLGGILAYNG
jgi:rhodanese-related sulfurtransferase